MKYKSILGIAILGALSALLTLATITQTGHKTVATLLCIDAALICILSGLIIRKLKHIWKNYTHKTSGARLKSKILVMFGLSSIVPAILIALFSCLFFRYVMDSWFDKNIERVLHESGDVATAYLKEHEESIKIRAKAMAMEVDNNIIKYDLAQNDRLFKEVISTLTDLNSLSEAAIFHNNKSIINSRLGVSLSLETFPEDYYQRALSGECVTINNSPNKVRAMTMLHSIPNGFLVIGELVDQDIITHVQKSKLTAERYKTLKSQIVQTQFRFVAGFLVITTLVLLVAIYGAIFFSDTITQPIISLVTATRKVQLGDFSAKVIENKSKDEIGDLSRAFNVMLERIVAQQYELMQAERYAAWSDVARRVAHEVKNPLTPIRLSAERIEKKYADGSGEPDVFRKYTSTIIKHVIDIGRIIEEFSHFARMPAPRMQEINLSELIQDFVLARQYMTPKVKYILDIQPHIVLLCDQTQINQLLINLIKNSEEAIETFNQTEGQIWVSLYVENKYASLTIQDNGGGFTKIAMNKATDIYFTTKDKGSGIGLAIVKKVVDDHGGKLIIHNSNGRAIVNILIPLSLSSKTS
jgi:two-component system nitrogen regulation sensor histidine kinase NtrY